MSKPPRAPWGAARVAVIAHLETIKAELTQGHPLKSVHQRHADHLKISYSAFCRLISRYAPSARPHLRPEQPQPPAPPSQPPAASRDDQTPPVPVRRTFEYDPVVRDGDRERLLGPLPERRR